MRLKKILRTIALIALFVALVPNTVLGQASGGPSGGSSSGAGYWYQNSNDRFNQFGQDTDLIGAGQTPKPLNQVIANIVRIILGFVGILLVLLILYGGFMWMTSAGNEQKIEKAKAIISNAVIGLVIIMIAYSIAYWVSTWLARAV